MSDDLMVRLRRYERYGQYDLLMERWPGRLANPDGPEAAAEINRLNAEVERLTRERDWHKALTQSHDMIADNTALKARADAAERKVERLTRERDVAQESHRREAHQRGVAERDAEAAERKVEKLREALENILQNARCGSQPIVAVVNLSWLVKARAALAETEKK